MPRRGGAPARHAAVGRRAASSAFLADGPRCHPQFAMLARRPRARCATPATRRGRAIASACALDRRRLRDYFLTQDGKPRSAMAPYRRPDCRHARRRGSGTATVRGARAARCRGARALPPRPERRALARRVADLRDRADASTTARSTRTRCSTFPDVLRRALELLKADGRVRAEPLPARSALSPRARRRVPGHEPRAVGAGGAARAGWGEGARRWRRTLRCRRRSSSSATASSRSTASATPTSAVLDAAAASSRACGPDGDVAAGDPQSFRAVPALLAFVNDVCSTPSRRRRAGPTRSRTASSDRFPVDGRRRSPARPVARRWWSATDRRTSAPTRSRDEIARLLRVGTTVRDRQTGVARAVAPRRHRDPVPLARQPSRVRGGARGARRRDLRLQGARLLRRRRDPGRRRAAPVPRRSAVGSARRGVPALADRAAVGRGAAAARAATRRRARGADPPADARARRRGSRACWRGARSACAALAAAGRSPAAVGAARSRARRVGLRVRAARAARSRRRART